MMLYPWKQIQAYLSANKHGFRKFYKGRIVLSFDDVALEANALQFSWNGMLDVFLDQ